MLLMINGGSSSIKFALYKQSEIPEKILSGQISKIGFKDIKFSFSESNVPEKTSFPAIVNSYASAIAYLISWLEKQVDLKKINAIGHRIVHGMQYLNPSFITPALVEELKQIIPYDPDHLPNEIQLIEVFKQHHPDTIQIACFDTAFHQTMPRVAKLLPIPRRFEKSGIHRYGFHGLSYQYLLQALERIAGKVAANGRVVLAHLGNGASLAAVHHGSSVDTSMSFTPAAGIPMSSRSGDLDPGVAWFIMKTEHLSADEFNHLVNHESGLLGISETSGDMNDLLKQAEKDIRAAEAVDLFCYDIKKRIGAYAAALGGIDTLVFSGGIGENAAIIRQSVCEGLAFLGIELDSKRNHANQDLISTDEGNVSVRVIPTDEEGMMAEIVNKMITDKAKQ
ncbi:acetate/propionate family kinase [Chitinophaga sp. 30R24]|uniref:acetate/propionate family kinase n=1 Tax=Chitinophaga sp. 30R24 TaxID=3248838 RepID=UPI003B8EF2E2